VRSWRRCGAVRSWRGCGCGAGWCGAGTGAGAVVVRSWRRCGAVAELARVRRGGWCWCAGAVLLRSWRGCGADAEPAPCGLVRGWRAELVRSRRRAVLVRCCRGREAGAGAARAWCDARVAQYWPGRSWLPCDVARRAPGAALALVKVLAVPGLVRRGQGLARARIPEKPTGSSTPSSRLSSSRCGCPSPVTDGCGSAAVDAEPLRVDGTTQYSSRSRMRSRSACGSDETPTTAFGPVSAVAAAADGDASSLRSAAATDATFGAACGSDETPTIALGPVSAVGAAADGDASSLRSAAAPARPSVPRADPMRLRRLLSDLFPPSGRPQTATRAACARLLQPTRPSVLRANPMRARRLLWTRFGTAAPTMRAVEGSWPHSGLS
jgi:hypothetical protein